jgi:hypothetical protein
VGKTLANSLKNFFGNKVWVSSINARARPEAINFQTNNAMLERFMLDSFA